MNLGIYSPQQEENIYIRREARTWQRSGLITNEQLNAIDALSDPDVRQTNIFFRCIFFIFTCLCAGAALGLFIWMTKIRSEVAISLTLIAASVIFYFLAEYAVAKYRFYRHGIEEALALTAMVLFCWGWGVLLNKSHLGDRQLIVVVSMLFALTAFWLYLRFGFLYAAFISMIAICCIPFQLSLTPTGERIHLLIILCLIFSLNIVLDRPENEDFRKERSTTIQAFLLAAIYLIVNLEVLGVIGLLSGDKHIVHFHPKLFPPYFYWSSYILSFIIPIAGIYWGIQSRKRLILNVSLIMACVALATNKSYLGWTRYAWDPAILGVVLVILSIMITRWLNSGENKARDGFTAEDILKPENHGIGLADVVAAVTPLATGMNIQQHPDQQGKYFDGGSSGGGGASRGF